MARLKNNLYKPMNVDELKDPVVFVVDMVNGFVKEGALADPEIMSIAEGQKKLMDQLECRNVFVCDTHPPKTREFLSYPQHCMIGTKEAEVVVNNFNEMNTILTKIGLKARNYQENQRHQFRYKDAEIDIDTWPLIPTYLEIEGKSEEIIKEVCENLGLDYNKSTTMDVTDIYNKIYNIDILKIKTLNLNQNR